MECEQSVIRNKESNNSNLNNSIKSNNNYNEKDNEVIDNNEITDNDEYLNDFQLNNSNSQFMPKCPLCDKTFANSSNLKHHMNTIHFNEAKWVCNECGKVCTSKSNLKVHLRVHLRVKPYYCRWCDYNCMHHSSIRDHLSKCHPEKSHNSCEPGYVFNSAAVPEPESSQVFEKNSIKNSEFIDSLNQSKLISLNSSSQFKKSSKKLAKIKSFKNSLKSNISSSILNNNNGNNGNNNNESKNCNLELIKTNKFKMVNNNKSSNGNSQINFVRKDYDQNHHGETDNDDLVSETNSDDFDYNNNEIKNETNGEESEANLYNNEYDNNQEDKNELINSNILASTLISNITKNLNLASNNSISKMQVPKNLPNNDFMTTFLQNQAFFPSSSSHQQPNPAVHLNNLAAVLIQRLSAAALMRNLNQNSNVQDNILNDNLNQLSQIDSSQIEEFHDRNINLKNKCMEDNDIESKINIFNNDNKKYPDLEKNISLKKQKLYDKNDTDKKTKLLNTSECSDEYVSSLSPSDSASTSSLKSSEYLKNLNSIDKKNNDKSMSSNEQSFLDKNKKLNNISATSKKSSNKAISEVINRLNMNLPAIEKISKNTQGNSDSFFPIQSLKIEKSENSNQICSNYENEKVICENKSHKKYSSAPVSPINVNQSEDITDESTYKCKFCNIIFNEYSLYSIHVGMHSNLNPWECSVCGQVCSNKVDFNVHILHLSKI